MIELSFSKLILANFNRLKFKVKMVVFFARLISIEPSMNCLCQVMEMPFSLLLDGLSRLTRSTTNPCREVEQVDV